MPLISTTTRTLIITGAFGSGKTECAIALAMQLARHEAVTLVDLDFVNPYFRSLDHRETLEAGGVTVIAPDASRAQNDAPALPPAARAAIVQPAARTLVDLGGDPSGAIVIGQYAPDLVDYELWAVVNFYRPTTATPEQAAALLREIMGVTRLRLTGVICNNYAGEKTETADLLAGLDECGRLGALLDVPVVLAVAPDGIPLPPLPVPVLRITRRLLRPWDAA